MEKQRNKIIPELARAEYIEVEPNVNLHITDAGEGSKKLQYSHIS